MNKIILVFIVSLITINSFGQNIQKIELNKEYSNIQISKSESRNYNLHLEKGKTYEISVLQQGIDVSLILADANNNQILEKDSPNGQNGYEIIEYVPVQTKDFLLKINRIDESGNPAEGKVTIFIKKFTKLEIQLKEKIKKELEPENRKNVQTLDIDHFWQAYDNLKTCKTRADSVSTIQKIYLDRATNGLLDFIQARNFTAKKFVNTISRFPKFYASIRKNTYEAKKAEPLIEEIFKKFNEVYSNFKPFKVCFAIGLLNTGGTVSNNFVLIGTEVTTSTKDIDLSEFNNDAFSKVLADGGNIVQKIKNIVSHECVHTQQKQPKEKDAIQCPLLYDVMQEGFCDFIGELVSGDQINKIPLEYGDNHEKELWIEFKNELCNETSKNWLYDYSTVKDKPADLGYYIGYKIAKEYYENAVDKKQAIIDIIEMKDPIKFLQLSKYDQKIKK